MRVVIGAMVSRLVSSPGTNKLYYIKKGGENYGGEQAVVQIDID